MKKQHWQRRFGPTKEQTVCVVHLTYFALRVTIKEQTKVEKDERRQEGHKKKETCLKMFM